MGKGYGKEEGERGRDVNMIGVWSPYASATKVSIITTGCRHMLIEKFKEGFNLTFDKLQYELIPRSLWNQLCF